MKRATLLLTAATLLGTAGAQSVTLDFWSHWGSEQRRPTINKIIDTWNKRNPNVQVRYTFVPFDQIQQKTLASVAAGNAPDVVVIDIRTSKLRASKKQNTNLSPLGAENIRGQFYPNLWTTGTYNGDQYALPFVTDTRFLFYNKEHFREAGLNPARGPRTWDELEAFAKRLDKKNGPVFSRIGFHPMYGDMGFEGWVQNAGADTWDANRVNPRFNTTQAVQTLEWIKNFDERLGYRSVQSFAATFGGGAQDAFISGKVSMLVKPANYVTNLQRFAPNLQYGMVRVPSPTGVEGPMNAWGGGFNVELPAGGKNTKQAYAFARWFVTEGARIWAREQNDFPAFKSASLSINTPAFRLMSATMDSTYVTEAPEFAPSYNSYLDKAVDDVRGRNADIKKALEDAQSQVVKIVAENKR